MTTSPDHADETPPPDRAEEEYPTLRGSIPSGREWARAYLVGLFMGTADAVPGVSGGTIALIAGIYERLITAVTAVTPRRFLAGLRALSPLDGGPSIGRALDVFEEVDGWFLVALLLGMFTAVIAVTGAINYADENHPTLLFGFFFGLIAASALVLLRAIRLRRRDELVAFLGGFAIAFLASGSETLLGGSGLALTVLAGAIAVSAMILPGISGSLLLVILGQYTYMSDTLHDFLGALGTAASGGGTDPLVQYGTVVVAFVAGGLVGVLTIARAIRRALDANRAATLAFLVALVVGALRAPAVRLGAKEGFAWSADALVAFGVAAAVGAAVVLVIDWYAVDLDLTPS